MQDGTCAGTFDVVVVNLYPFYDKVTSAADIEFEDGIENVDIGGPAMIRAAAKVLYYYMFMFIIIRAQTCLCFVYASLHLNWEVCGNMIVFGVFATKALVNQACD